MTRFLSAQQHFALRVGEGYDTRKLTAALEEADDLGVICGECKESPEDCTCFCELPANPMDMYQFTEN